MSDHDAAAAPQPADHQPIAPQPAAHQPSAPADHRPAGPAAPQPGASRATHPVELHRSPVPTAADTPWAVTGSIEVDRANELDARGYDDLVEPVADRSYRLQHQDDVDRTLIVATEPGAPHEPASVLGYTWVGAQRADPGGAAGLDVVVRPDARGRGVGAALVAAAVEVARGLGVRSLQTWSDVPTIPAPSPGALAPSTGTGTAPADSPATRFALAHGFTLEQVERQSRLDVPADPGVLDALEATALDGAGDDYRVRVLDPDEIATLPDALLADLAALESRMATDAPSGGLDVSAVVWDAARMRRYLDALTAGGAELAVSVAEHVPSGRVVAYTVLVVRPAPARTVTQETTIVDPEHRGHRLGLLVKVANQHALERLRPDVRRVVTWNAEENAHMLAINVAMGFVPDGGGAAWQRRVTS